MDEVKALDSQLSNETKLRKKARGEERRREESGLKEGCVSPLKVK